MWSGPRNLSTAMMYSFGSRADCAIWDEPFYAPYLAETGSDHPMAKEILSAHETNPKTVSKACLGSIPDGKPHFYMKHMPHHMMAGFPMDWAADCVNVHLIRHPARVVASYAAKREDPTLSDIGFVQQAEVFRRFPGPVVDTFDIREDPEATLKRLCAEIGLPWDHAMLSWPAGGRKEDGVWAAHWYGAIHRSTGFGGGEGPLPDVSPKHAELVAEAMPYYQELAAGRLAP